MRKKSNTTLVILLTIIVVVGLIGFSGFSRLPSVSNQSADAGSARIQAQSGQANNIPCMNQTLPVSGQNIIHPHLQIIIDGQSVAIPANIGISLTCERVVNTRDDTGTINVESNSPGEFALGDFFSVWGAPFSKERIFNFGADQSHEIVMTVNGATSTDYQNLVLKNEQQIIIEYKSK